MTTDTPTPSPYPSMWNYPVAPPPPPQKKKSKTKIVLGSVAAIFAVWFMIGFIGGGDESTTSSSSSSSSTSTRASATATPTTKSAAELQAEQAAVEAARAAETARMDPATYEVITPREYAILVRDPDAAKGRKLVIYGRVTQFDAATGTSAFRANTAAELQSSVYNYDVNSMVSAPAGWSNILANVVEDDVVVMYVEVVGAISYDTQIGGNTTAPQFQVNMINVIGATE